jgi:hypothetical protein
VAARAIPEAAPAIATKSARAALADTDMVGSLARRDTVMPDTEAAPEQHASSPPTLVDALARAPMPSAPVTATPARRGWIVPVLLLLVLLVGAAAGGAAVWFMTGARAIAASAPTGPTATATPPPAKRLHTRSSNPPMKSYENAGVLESVLNDEGWATRSWNAPKPTGGTAPPLNVLIDKDGKSGLVAFHHSLDETVAMATETANRSNPDTQCKRSGVFVLCITIESDVRAARDLLVAITR